MAQPDGSYLGQVSVTVYCSRAAGRVAVRASAGGRSTAYRRAVRVSSRQFRADFADSDLLAGYLDVRTRQLVVRVRACGEGGCTTYRAVCRKRANECSLARPVRET